MTGERTFEHWMFGGTRIDKDGKKVHAWLPLPATDLSGEMLWKPHSSFTIGTVYRVPVTRVNGEIVKYNDIHYDRVERYDNGDIRALAEGRHRAAETRYRNKRLEAGDKKDSALDAALEPLVTLSMQLTPADRDAFLAYVIRRITKPWQGMKSEK